MFKKIKCIADFEGDTLTHGGVTFRMGKAETVDTSTVEVYPFFEGNPSFVVEDAENETAETETRRDDDDAVAGTDSGSESFGFDYQAATRDELVEYLEGREIKFGKRLSVDKLRKLAEQNV